MKTITYYSICIATILWAMPLLASDMMNVEASLREFFSSDGTLRLSGKGTYICTVYKKVVDVNDLLEGREFEGDQDKQRYLRIIRLTTGLDFSLKQDKTTYTLERLQFHQGKKRRDYASLSPAMVESIRNDPNVIGTLSLKTYAFDGDKTTSLVSAQMADSNVVYANISHRRIYFPEFHRFGYGESVNDLQMFFDLIDQGAATFKRSTVDGQVHATLEIAKTGFKMERIFAPDKGMSILYTSLYMNNQLNQETICQDYARTSSGEWFPREYISNKYAYIKGQKLLTSSETFEAIPGTVDFNIPLKPSIFSLELPVGTKVIDERHTPPKEFVIGVLPLVNAEDKR